MNMRPGPPARVQPGREDDGEDGQAGDEGNAGIGRGDQAAGRGEVDLLRGVGAENDHQRAAEADGKQRLSDRREHDGSGQACGIPREEVGRRLPQLAGEGAVDDETDEEDEEAGQEVGGHELDTAGDAAHDEEGGDRHEQAVEQDEEDRVGYKGVEDEREISGAAAGEVARDELLRKNPM